MNKINVVSSQKIAYARVALMISKVKCLQHVGQSNIKYDLVEWILFILTSLRR